MRYNRFPGWDPEHLIVRFTYLSAFILLFACQPTEEKNTPVYRNIEKELQSRLILAENGDTIQLQQGHFSFSRSLLVDDKKNLVIQGKGIDKTVLSFKKQTEGAEGLRITNSKNITLRDFTIQDSPGDNIKVMDTDWITFNKVKTTWTGGAKSSNGAYGFYPVKCNNVLIENCIASGASDAGIYVGQSNYAIIRNNKVFENVAGIESENSKYVDIYGNETYENTGGILIFDLPGLSQYGKHIRVFDNIVKNNNHKNFAPEGNIVAIVPPGTGILVLATTDVEIFDNTIHHNKTTGTGLISYVLVNEVSNKEIPEDSSGSAQRVNTQFEQDKNYNPFVRSVFIHDNDYKNKHWFPSLSNEFGKLFLWKFPFNTPDIIYDGIVSKNTGLEGPAKICIKNNSKATFANLDAAHNFKALSKDLKPYDCTHKGLEAVQFPEPTSTIQQTKKSSKTKQMEPI